ncbi:Wadjet anti-phage system protein JetD domain-containing protein [Sulfurovum mangrovi]|uniref:Wadjet anti-phage system protein JetD domain-containing protein n=1 Tax=Sulfurovum mangrovi TaxID=2893889 RepID=UPI001E424334|nr:Wadjet anti-phage system protein JetD domain-containing protein [Sulfurovum mangrovi]UFH60387.1 DUF2220 family protein [Sulfurovum mangrovi]
MNTIETDHLKTLLAHDINRELVGYFLTLLEKTPSTQRDKPLKLSMNPVSYKQCLKKLYEPSEVNGEIAAEQNIRALAEAGVVSVEYRDKHNTFALYKRKAMLYFNVEFEALCREILDRKISHYKAQWQEAIAVSHLAQNVKEVLLNTQPIELENKSAKNVIDRIENYLKLDRSNDLVREASAFIFWGHSKILDNRPEFWDMLKIEQQPIQILVSLKNENCKSILFIENKQTFESLQRNESLSNRYILIYLSGFMGTASRLIDRKYRSFYINAPGGIGISNEDLHAIFDHQSEFHYYFWGDLDYEGINIYLALKKLFSSVVLWEPGYGKMIQMLSVSNGHTASAAKKTNQQKPGKTFERYIDDLLIPQMEEKGFFDQEGILFDSVE